MKNKSSERKKKYNREYSKRMRRENPEETKEKDRLRYIKYRDTCIASSKKWYQDNKDCTKFKELRNKSKTKYNLNNKEKNAARYALRNAVAKGLVKRPNVCSKCKKIGNVDGHHEDYTKPLDVTWLCRDCHSALHREVKNAL